MKFQWEVRIAGLGGRPSQDCAAVIEIPQGLRLALADGVGGQSGGREAAQRAVEEWLASPHPPELALAETDSLLSRLPDCGLTTSIYLQLADDNVQGASLGDSRAWLLTSPGQALELTAWQRPKPYAGSGQAVPIRFSHDLPTTGCILVCSDGLWRPVGESRLLDIAARGGGDELLNAVSPPTDDISLILVRW